MLAALAEHVDDHRGKYSLGLGVLAFSGQLAYHIWEKSFDEWFWDRYVRGVAAKCAIAPTTTPIGKETPHG